MKKICAFFAAILFTVSAALLFTSCIQQPVETQLTETQATAEFPAERVTGDNGERHHVPPHCLEFTDLSEVSNLFSAVEMEKEELEIYLSSKNYDMNGIYTKDHIVVLEKTASRIPYPSLTGGALEFFHLYPDDYAFFVRYSLEHGCVQVTVHTGSYPVKEEDIQTKSTSQERLASCNQDVLYYYNSDHTPQGVPRLVYGAIVEGYYVSFLVFDMPREVADEIVKSVTFDPLAEILKNHSTGNQNGE